MLSLSRQENQRVWNRVIKKNRVQAGSPIKYNTGGAAGAKVSPCGYPTIGCAGKTQGRQQTAFRAQPSA
jgi:hypothetical protein